MMSNQGGQDFNPEASPFNPNLVSNGNLVPGDTTRNGHRPRRSGDSSRGSASRASSRASSRPSARTPSRPSRPSSRATFFGPHIMQPIPRYGPSVPYAPYFPGHYGAGFSFAVPMPSGIEYPTYSAVPTQLMVPNRPSSVPAQPIHQPIPQPTPQPAPQPAPQALPQVGGRQAVRLFNPKTNRPLELAPRRAASAEVKKDVVQAQVPTQTVSFANTKPPSQQATEAASHIPVRQQSSEKALKSLPVRDPVGPGPFGFKVAGSAPFPNEWSWDMKAEQVKQEADHKVKYDAVKAALRESIPEAQMPLREVAHSILGSLKSKADVLPPRQEAQPRVRSSTAGSGSIKHSPPYRGSPIAIGTRGLTPEQLLDLQRARSAAALAEPKPVPQQEKKRGDDDTSSVSSSHNGSNAPSVLGPQYPMHLQLATQRAMNTMAHAAARERATVPSKAPVKSAEASAAASPPSSTQDMGVKLPIMTKTETQKQQPKLATARNAETVSGYPTSQTVNNQSPAVVQTTTYPSRPRPGEPLPYDKMRGMYIPNMPAPRMSPTSAAAAGRVEEIHVTPLPPLSPIRRSSRPYVRPSGESGPDVPVASAPTKPQPDRDTQPHAKPASQRNDSTNQNDPAIISAKPMPSKTVANPNATALPSLALPLAKKPATMSAYPQFGTTAPSATSATHSPTLSFPAVLRADGSIRDLHPPSGPFLSAARTQSVDLESFQHSLKTLRELQQQEQDLLLRIHTKPTVPESRSATDRLNPSTSTAPGPARQVSQPEPFTATRLPQPATHEYHKARSTSVAIETRQFHQVADYYNGQRPAQVGRYVPLPEDWLSAYPMIPLTPTGRRRTDREMARYLTKLDRDFYSGSHIFGMNMHQVIEEVRVRHIDALFLAESLGVSRAEHDSRFNQYTNLSKTYKQPTPFATMTCDEVMALEKRKVVEPMLVILFRQLLLQRAEEGLPASHKTWRSQYFSNSHPAIVRVPEVMVQGVSDEEGEEEGEEMRW